MLVKRYYRTRSIDCRGRSAILTQFIFPLRSQNSFLWNQNIRYYHSELNSRLLRKITTFWPSTWKNIRLISKIKLKTKGNIIHNSYVHDLEYFLTLAAFCEFWFFLSFSWNAIKRAILKNSSHIFSISWNHNHYKIRLNSAVFLQRQKRIVNYYIKKFIKESQ